jgi:hypothetical protein
LLDVRNKSCPECLTNFKIKQAKQKFCSKNCQWNYNARLRREQKTTTIKSDVCLKCKCSITKPKRMFSSVVCKNKFNHKRHNYKYQIKSKSRTPYVFLNAILKKKQRELNIDEVYGIYLRQKGLCAITKRVMTHELGNGKVQTNISIDRIDSAKGYTIDNVQLVCYIVNIMKNEMSLNDLRRWCDLISNPSD